MFRIVFLIILPLLQGCSYSIVCYGSNTNNCSIMNPTSLMGTATIPVSALPGLP